MELAFAFINKKINTIIYFTKTQHIAIKAQLHTPEYLAKSIIT